MKASNFSEFINAVENNGTVTNRQAVKTVGKGARKEIDTAVKSPMYIIRQLNKLYAKNDFVEGVNIRVLGKGARNYALANGHNVNAQQPFTLYLFVKGADGALYYRALATTVNGVSCKKEKYVTTKKVTLTVQGFRNAIQSTLDVEAWKADAEACAEAKKEKAEQKARAKEAKKHAKEAKKKAHAQAVIDYNAGRITAEQFAAIMCK